MIYSKVEIQNFRCFKNLKIEKMQRVNLITGKNNVGKTAFLETLFIMAGTSGELMLRTDSFRGMPGVRINLSGTGATESPLNSFFYNFSSDREITLKAENGKNWRKIIIKSAPPSTLLMSTSNEDGRTALRGEQSRDLCELIYEDSSGEKFTNKIILFPEKNQISFGDKNRPALFEAIFLHNVSYNPKEDVGRLGRLLEIKKDKEIIEELKVLEPRLEDIRIGNDTILVGLEGMERRIPLALSGLGMIKILRLVVSMLSAPGGVVLVDEIEVGLHWKALSSVWQVVEKVAREYDVQVVATTHSLECIRSAVDIFSASDSFNLGVFRLEQSQGTIISVSYDKESINAALDNDLEIR